MRLNRRLLRELAAGLVAIATLVLPATAYADAFDSIRIENFGAVNANYYRGAQPVGRDYAALAAAGIRTDIDLTKDGDPAEQAAAERAGLKFFRIPMTTHMIPTPDQIAKFLHIVSDPANQPVYVHCQGGRHRTGVMTAIYRITTDHWSADQAFSEMKRYRFGADFLHREFVAFVHDYPAQLARAMANQPAVAARQ